MANDDSDNYGPAQSLKAAMGCFATGVTLFILLWMLDWSGADMSKHWLLGSVQKIGGQWTVAVIFGSLGAFLVVMALLGTLKSQK